MMEKTTPAPLMAELMYLNYVRHKNKVWQVNDIYGASGLMTVLPDENGEGLGRRSIHDFEPIPLTEQWLKEFGFREHETIWWITIGKDKRIQFDGDGCMIEIINEFIRLKHIKYVHQLQNLYFCLCGTKLERGGV